MKWLLSTWELDPGDKEDLDIKAATEEIHLQIQGKVKRKLELLRLKCAKGIYKYDPRE